MSNDGLKFEKNQFEKYSKGISSEDLVWLKNKILGLNQQLKDQSNSENEEKFLMKVNDWLYGIEISKPSNIREYVERKLRKDQFDRQLGDLMKEIWTIAPGDIKSCNEAGEKMRKLLDAAEHEFPDFVEKRGLMVSEMRGDLMALRTNGKAGSSRMLRRIKEEGKK